LGVGFWQQVIESRAAASPDVSCDISAKVKISGISVTYKNRFSTPLFNVRYSFPNIVCTEGTLAGSPRIDGRRLAVSDVVGFLRNYGSLQEVISDYELTISDIRQALHYCSMLQCKEDKPAVFCHNCSLRREQEGPLDISNLEEVALDDLTFVKSDNLVFLGSKDELLDEWQGQNWWKIAMDLLIDFRSDLFEGKNRS
jgi:uncharacterized protein (DUF433 family)